jgi:glycosyltransferase involved in cell wall biosynthesis
MKKKKLLFIMNSLHCGGAENSLISLLQILDYTKYEVDLLLFNKEGFFLKNVPIQVNILPPVKEFQMLEGSFVKAILKAFFQLRFDVIFTRIKFLSLKSEKNAAVREQKFWKYLAVCLPKLKGTYDTAIGFLEKTPNYYCVDKVTAHKKIGFIRTDYKAMQMDESIDKPYFEKLDIIATNSDNATKTMKEIFPEFDNKIITIENFFAPQTLFALAEEQVAIPQSDLMLVSVGRLIPLKGFDLAIEACKILVDKNINVKWFVLGEGQQRESLQAKIDNYKLQNNFYLLGEKDNPYPYIKQADIYIHTSQFEGKSRAIEEAKILQKPIISTNFPSVINQLEHNKTGIIVDFNANEIAENILKLHQNITIKNTFRENLQQLKSNNKDSLNYFYSFIN